jgi:hypothetical protein
MADGDLPPVPRFGPGEHTKYVPDHKSFGAFIKSDQMRDVTEEVAKDIAQRASDLSPRSTRGGDQDGKRMADQFKVVRNAGLMKVAGNLRVKVLVVNNARSAAPLEFGTSKNKRHRMLGRAGAEFGDFKPEGGPGA